MAVEIEPNQKLVEYFMISNQLPTQNDGSRIEFYHNAEWHYILSNIEQNILLLKRLDEKGLLQNENHICDCGIGLGVALFDFYQQSKEFTDKKFYFYGIEKQKDYINFLKSNLLIYWQSQLNLIEDDLMNCNYSDYNIVYTYTPFKTYQRLKNFYNKIVSEVKSGSILIENKSSGLGLHGVMTEISGLRKIAIDEIVVFQKI